MKKSETQSKSIWVPKRKLLKFTLSFILIFVIFLIWAMFSQIIPGSYKTKTIRIAGEELNVEVADTVWKRKIGLSYKQDLDRNSGMLFEFDDKKQYSIVMRGMDLDIDILWISDNTVVYFEEFVPRDSKKSYKSPIMADKILEVRAGWIEKNNIGIGASYQEL